MMLNFEIKGWKETKEKLQKYQKSVDDRLEVFISKLLDVGIQTANLYKDSSVLAENNTQNLGQYVTFTKEVEGNTGKLIGVDIPIQTAWKNKAGIHTATVYPLLMLEFGSAFFGADPPEEKYGGFGGKGTMSTRDKSHWNDLEWWWIDLEGRRHKNYAIRPTMPMYEAYKEMIMQVNNVAKEVYGNGK
jgi:hypothetical protein